MNPQDDGEATFFSNFSAGEDLNGADTNSDVNLNNPNFVLNNEKDLFDEEYPNTILRHSPLLMVLYCVAYFIVFIVGVLGNCFVVAVVYRSPRMRTVTNYFIVNLAAADLIIIFCLPATLIGNLFHPWILGWWACKTVPYLQGVSVSASINTLVAISLDRFLAICHPLKWQITTRICRYIILIIWIFSFSITLPWALYFTLTPMDSPDNFLHNPNRQMCHEVWPNEKMNAIFFLVAHMLIDYLLPLVIITVCYILIWVRVRNRRLPGETKDQSTDLMIHRSKIKVIKMLMAVVIMFALSWLPLYAIMARIKIQDPMVSNSLEEEFVTLAIPVAQWLGASNSCVNPILYAFFNKKFRAGFKSLLTGNRCCRPLRNEYALTKTGTLCSTATIRSNGNCTSNILKSSYEKRHTVLDRHDSTRTTYSTAV